MPSWHRDSPDVPGLEAAEAEDGAIHIELDPGLAFGTGSHPTTHLCLAWLEAELPKGATLLDYGCGSGILAIAARKLGAGPTQAVDIDAQAVQSTVFNAEVNHVELQAMLPDGLADGTFEVVVDVYKRQGMPWCSTSICMSILSSISERAVTTSTGASSPAARSSRMTVKPSLPGRLMSSTRASQVSSRPQRSAATPSRTHWTLWPAERSLLSTASPRSRLSSTSRRCV